MNSQFVLVELHNTEPYIYRFFSEKEITIERVSTYMLDYEDFDPEEDAISFVDIFDRNLD